MSGIIALKLSGLPNDFELQCNWNLQKPYLNMLHVREIRSLCSYKFTVLLQYNYGYLEKYIKKLKTFRFPVQDYFKSIAVGLQLPNLPNESFMLKHESYPVNAILLANCLFGPKILLAAKSFKIGFLIAENNSRYHSGKKF